MANKTKIQKCTADVFQECVYNNITNIQVDVFYESSPASSAKDESDIGEIYIPTKEPSLIREARLDEATPFVHQKTNVDR